MSEAQPAPRESAPDSIPLTEGRVDAKWVGAAGHMTPEHYATRFAEALAELLEDHLNLGAERVEGSHVHALQSATHYLHPLQDGDDFNVEARMLQWDPAHMRLFFTMWRGDEIAATCEQLLRNASNDNADEAVPFPEAASKAIERMYSHQAGLPLPQQAGKPIELGSRD